MKLDSRFVTVSLADLVQYLAIDHYMGKREAEGYTRLSAKTLIAAPDLPKYQPNGKILFRKSEIDRWMGRHTRGETLIDFDCRMEQLQQEFRRKKA